MEFDTVIDKRRSIRRFLPEPVSDEMIHKLIEAARVAPSGSNIQPWRFVVVRSAEVKDQLREATVFRFVLKAPVLLVCCADLTALETRSARVMELFESGAFENVELDGEYTSPERNQEQNLSYLSMNVGIAVTYLMLKAVDLGLGTCWIGAFDPVKTKEILKLDTNLHVVALLPVGYPVKIPAPRPRFSLEELLVKIV